MPVQVVSFITYEYLSLEIEPKMPVYQTKPLLYLSAPTQNISSILDTSLMPHLSFYEED